MKLRIAFLWSFGGIALTAQAARAQEGPADTKAKEAPLAVVGGAVITAGEVEELAGPQLAELRQKAYQVRTQAVDELIARRVLEAEAKRRGMSVEALLQAEIEAKVVTTDADRKALYEANKSRFSGMSEADAMRQVEPAARQQKRRERQNAYIRELRARAGVEVRLEPPRAALTVPADAPSRGPAAAPITLVEFSDFQCPYCVRAQPVLQKVREAYPDKVRFVFLDFPLDMHPQARKAHEAASCAGDQGKFWPMYDRLFGSEGKLEVANLKSYAGELGLDAVAFAQCLDSARHAARTEAGLEEGARNGVTGTPAFFINGRMLVGAQPFEAFAQVIDDELARAARASLAPSPKEP